MDIKTANKILNKKGMVNKRGELACYSPYIDYYDFKDEVHLDGRFTTEELEAIICYMMVNYKPEKEVDRKCN